MMPRLGVKYKDIEIEIMSKSVAEYHNDEYFELELPVAPAIMVGDELLVQGCDMDEEKVEAAICRHLGLPEPEPQKKEIFTEDILKASLSERVCYCSNVTKDLIMSAIREGAHSLEAIKIATGACTAGKCKELSPRKR